MGRGKRAHSKKSHHQDQHKEQKPIFLHHAAPLRLCNLVALMQQRCVGVKPQKTIRAHLFFRNLSSSSRCVSGFFLL
jgi:hypothetical protein